MFEVDEDMAEIRIKPANYAVGASLRDLERLTQMLLSDCRSAAIVLSRHTGVKWTVRVVGYTGL